MSKKIIHIFDMDDTLFETPSFAEFSGTEDGSIIDITKFHPGYFIKIKAAFWENLSKDVVFKRMGDFIVPVNTETNKPFDGVVLNYFPNKNVFGLEKGILVINSIPGFHRDPDTIGIKGNESVLNDYETAENKMILTGRGEDLREKIIYILKYMGLSYPNFGLKLFQPSHGLNVEQYKVKTILSSIKDNAWNTVHFYEDRLDWLVSAKTAVMEIYPQVEFISHPITDVKNKRNLNMA